MWSSFFLVSSAIVMFLVIVEVNSKFEFTNIKCNCPDKEFCGFEYCFLKSINRTYKYFSVKVNLHLLPVTNFTGNFALYQRLNGYKPFLYNITVDGCKFLGNVKSGNPVIKYFYAFFSTYGNMNHKCPFDHDIFVEKVPANVFDYRLSQVLPFPPGDYKFELTFIIVGFPYANIQLYGSLS